MRVLFFVEGFTDIRFVVGLSEICDLTMAVPAKQYTESGLKQRVIESKVPIIVDEISGNRLAFQIRSFAYLWKKVRDFDVILSQEVLRGSLNTNLVGLFKRVPVVTYMGISPVEYFRCRRERRQIGPIKGFLGEILIRTLMTINGRLATRCLAMGPYLRDIAAPYCPRSEMGLYYGVDTEVFHPAEASEITMLRKRHDLPTDKFIVFLSSRISHEKDPETVLLATSIARSRGLDAVLINLGGGFEDFIKLAEELKLPDWKHWVIGRPAAHPMSEVADYFRAADVMALASFAEGAAFSTLEALACGTPVVATAVGGMRVQLDGYARLVPCRDPNTMAHELLWIAKHREEAVTQALKGREYVIREWNRQKAFRDLLNVLTEVNKTQAKRELL